VGRGVAESGMESQHLRLQSDKIHPFQIIVWRGAYNSTENKASQRQNKGGGHK
jgi:hypothetical protein